LLAQPPEALHRLRVHPPPLEKVEPLGDLAELPQTEADVELDCHLQDARFVFGQADAPPFHGAAPPALVCASPASTRATSSSLGAPTNRAISLSSRRTTTVGTAVTRNRAASPMSSMLTLTK